MRDCIADIALFGQQNAESEVRRRKAGFKLRRPLDFDDRLMNFAHSQIGGAQIEMGVGGVRARPHHLFQVRDRLRDTAGLQQGEGEVVARFLVCRLNLQGVPVMLNRCLELAGPKKNVSQIVMRLEALGIVDRFFRPQGLLILKCLAVSPAQSRQHRDGRNRG